MKLRKQQTKSRVNLSKVKAKPTGRRYSHNISKAIRGSDIETADNESQIFPGCAIWMLHVCVLAGRLSVCGSRSHWWILHPDEVYQSIEVAHSEVYGYGFRPYEYLRAPPANTTSLVERQEAALGMYSLRSFLYPRIFVLVFAVKEALHMRTNPFLVARVFHGAVAAHLPLTVYYFTSQLLSKDVAVLSAIFTAFSVPLAVLGTHPLVNSFLSPIVFMCMGLVARLLATGCVQTFRTKPRPLNAINQRHGANFARTADNTSEKMKKSHTPLTDNDKIETKKNFDSSNMEAHAARNDVHLRDKNFNIYTDGKIETRVANRQYVSFSGEVKLFVCGIILGLACYIRIDLILFLGLTMLLVMFCCRISYLVGHADATQTTFRTLCPLIGGFAVSLVLGGSDDYVTYGTWFISPYQWFVFNIRNETANIIFGCKTFFFYLQLVILADSMALLLFLSVVTCFVLLLTGRMHCSTRDRNTALALNTTCVLLFIIYSMKGHKELRFVHNGLVLYAVCCANAVVLFCQSGCVSAPRGKTYYKAGVYVIAFAVALTCIVIFPRPSNGSNGYWSYMNVSDSNYINDCLDFVGRQEGATGVFLDRSIHVTAGYSVLHKDIPVFTLIHYEFTEFDKEARKTLHANWLVFDVKTERVNVSIIGRISEFISTKNSPLLLKRLITNPKYNYLIVKSDRRLVSFGYRQVYASGTMRVMKRADDKRENEALRKLAESIPMGANGSTLEYEGSWLYTLSLHRKAVERLEAALVLDPDLVRAYQLLVLANIALGSTRGARSASQRCARVHGSKTCRTFRDKLVLHSDYNLKVGI